MTQSTAPLLLIPGAVVLIALYFGWQTFAATQTARRPFGVLFWLAIAAPVALSLGLYLTSNALLVFEGAGTDHGGFSIRKCHYFTGHGVLVTESMRPRCPNWLKTNG